MPKRSERDLYSHRFDGNPYEGMNPYEIYESVKWGNNPANVYNIDAPEPVISLGELAKIVTNEIEQDFSEKEAPYLAIGAESNYIYIIPKHNNKPLNKIPEFNPDSKEWQEKGYVEETHYYSDKGEEEAYYYHEHENPYPNIWFHKKSGVCILIPSDNDGKPSYAVAKEGIIG